MNAIDITSLVKTYKEIDVVDIPKLAIAQGESFGLVGNNGAGKTTLFRMILDLIRPSDGTVLSFDEDVQKNEDWKTFTGSYLDEGFLIDFLTPDEYFDFIAKINQLSEGDVNEFLGGFEDVFNDEIRGKKKLIRDLSKGNQKKVGIAAALMMKPKVLLLDEPFANLDPSTQIKLKKYLNEVKSKQEITMLISSHDLNHITEVCERIVVLEKGKVIHDIKSSENTLKELEEYFAVQ